MTAVPVSEKQRRKAMAFVQCPSCSWDLGTGEGRRSCFYGDCPYLPEALQLHCPTCWYDFATNEGQPGCADPPTCAFARDVVPARLEVLRDWLAAQT